MTNFAQSSIPRDFTPVGFLAFLYFSIKIGQNVINRLYWAEITDFEKMYFPGEKNPRARPTEFV